MTGVITQSGRGTATLNFTDRVLVENKEYVTGGQIDTDYPWLRPGSMAYTADGKVLYVKGLDGRWTPFLEDEKETE